MSRWCQHIALTPTEEATLRDVADEGDIALEQWMEDIGYPPDSGLDGDSGEWPLKLTVLGGEPLHEEWVRTFWLVSADEVAELASALHEIDESWFRKRFFSLPDKQYHSLDEDVFAWVWDCFREVRELYQSAAAQGLAVVCTISH